MKLCVMKEIVKKRFCLKIHSNVPSSKFISCRSKYILMILNPC